ncbi:MAG: hypothetical protein K9N62_17800 [Verrucomicrobia bacterium]|nr:hypothetical protein [Verrucomicrobiota bacterium]
MGDSFNIESCRAAQISWNRRGAVVCASRVRHLSAGLTGVNVQRFTDREDVA